ncbi:MAG: GntR family transcriptional regulator [Candidatus Rokubacteria bacterium]|nr:GntR family transcriptional regulator [Candidatus Rokubacteria bacterium]
MAASDVRFDDATPLHLQLRNLVRSSIEAIEHSPGSRLPPERTLAEMYGVSRITVRQALDALAREGLVRRGRGRGGGTFVQDHDGTAGRPKVAGSFGALYSSRQIERVDILTFARRASSGEVSTALGLAPGSEVRYIERLFIAPRGPLAHVRSFLPPPIGDRLRRSELRTMMLHEALVRRHRVKISEARDEIEAALADSVAARLLDVELGRALVRVRRVLVGRGDKPIALSLMVIATHRYQLVIRHPASRE